MRKILLYSHGGSGNRGCEAIVRSTQKILNNTLKVDNICLATLNKSEDEEVHIDKDINLIEYSNYVRRKSKNHILAAINYKLTGNTEHYIKLAQKNLYNNFSKDTIALSIGGDNYCYSDSRWLYLSNSEAKKRGARTILWGCSIEGENLSNEMINDLSGYDLIIARESITYNMLKEKNINNNVKLYPDPAFQLDYINSDINENLIDKNTIGINLSPYIFKSKLNEDKVIEMYSELIKHIINTSDMKIVLIPHVFWKKSNDLEVLNKVYSKVKEYKRVSIITEKYNCNQLKKIISKCRMFIGARTHSTIAAYSTCVPTLVLGYSVKSRGIARDIFGNEKDMVISVQDLNNSNDLINIFNTFFKNEYKIREYLEEFMPKYIELAMKAADEINSIV